MNKINYEIYNGTCGFPFADDEGVDYGYSIKFKVDEKDYYFLFLNINNGEFTGIGFAKEGYGLIACDEVELEALEIYLKKGALGALLTIILDDYTEDRWYELLDSIDFETYKQEYEKSFTDRGLVIPKVIKIGENNEI